MSLGEGMGGLLNLAQAGQYYSYLYDGSGNVEAVLNSAQAVVAAYRYDPFGNLTAKTGAFSQPYLFSTKRYDAQTGLIDFGKRFYSPAMPRWTTRDPLGEAGGLNLYAFVGNNPVNWVDPWGLFRSNSILRALVPGQVQFDAAMTAFENCDYLGTVAYTGQMLTYQLLFVGMLGQSPTVQQRMSSSISGIHTAGVAMTGWWQYIQNNWIRIDPSGTWGKNGSQSGPHCHFDPIPGSRELMRYHLPSQFRAWYGNFWSIINRR